MLRRKSSVLSPLLDRAFMACSTRNHPFFKQFNGLPVRTCSFDGFNVGVRINRSAGMMLTLRSCFNDCWRPSDQKARAFAPQLARDLEVGAGFSEADKDTRFATNGRGGLFQRGKPVRFSDISNKIVVAVDVDEVLGNFVSALNKFIADRYSSIHSVSEYHVYEFFKIWNCSRNEADIRVHEFFKTPYFKNDIHPLPGAHEALNELSRFCNLVVVTSRQNVIKDHTIEWIEKHYPGLFQEIHFGNHFALDGESKPKSEICRSLGAKILIDDNPRYALECARVGIRVLLFDYENSYPWCKTESVDDHPLVTKVHNWEEVEQQLVSWTVS